MNNRITIMIATRDRHSEIALCIQGLRTQSFQNWDLIIADESQTPIQNCHFLMYLINRIKLEGHKVKLIRNNLLNGVCYIRNLLIKENDFNNTYSARIDDDVILESDYLQKMITGLELGYDIMSGVTPHMASPQWERQPELIGKVINDIELDSNGNISKYNDDCGMCYDTKDSIILPATNFRSCAVYKSELETDIKYPDNLSFVGFREELWFSIKAILLNKKIGVDISARAYHFITPSGGCRFPDYPQKVQQDEETTRKWIAQKYNDKGDFIAEYKKRLI
jgi:hypothetical protein